MPAKQVKMSYKQSNQKFGFTVFLIFLPAERLFSSKNGIFSMEPAG